MFTGSYGNNKILATLEAVLLACIVCLASSAGYTLAVTLSDSLSIPYDLSLTALSFGFGNNIVILFTLFVFIVSVLVIEKAIPALVEYIVWQ